MINLKFNLEPGMIHVSKWLSIKKPVFSLYVTQSNIYDILNLSITPAHISFWLFNKQSCQIIARMIEINSISFVALY